MVDRDSRGAPILALILLAMAVVVIAVVARLALSGGLGPHRAAIAFNLPSAPPALPGGAPSPSPLPPPAPRPPS